jgi:hypothetical protein
MRYVCYLLAGLAINAVSISRCNAADHIEIVREVLLERGLPAMPKQLVPTNDGDIIVAGGFSNKIPWATRVDADGKVRWRYLMEMEQWQPGDGDASYESAATLPDDSTVLSGFTTVPVPGRSTRATVGLLSHLDQTGKVISHRQLFPQGDHSFGGIYLRRSVPWGDGVVVIGETGRARKVADDYVLDSFFWLIALNATGEIKWEKLIPNTDPRPLSDGFPLVGVAATPGHELVLVASDSEKRASVMERGRRVIRLNDKGDVVGERFFPGSLLLARQVNPKSEITLFPTMRLGENGVTMWTVSSDLANARQLAGSTRRWVWWCIYGTREQEASRITSLKKVGHVMPSGLRPTAGH